MIDVDDTTVKFSVEGLWKGAPVQEIVMRNDAGGTIVSDCAYQFILGKKYLVYASSSGDGLDTHKCSRTTVLESAGADVEVLEKMKAKEPEKRLSSFLALSPSSSQELRHLRLRSQALWFENIYVYPTHRLKKKHKQDTSCPR